MSEFKRNEKGEVDVTGTVGQYVQASKGEPVTAKEVGKFRDTCVKFAKWYAKSSMQSPLGYVDLQNAVDCIGGNFGHGSEINNKDDLWPSVAVYAHSPIDITASVLAKLIINAEESGPLTADDLRTIYQFMVPPKDEVAS